MKIQALQLCLVYIHSFISWSFLVHDIELQSHLCIQWCEGSYLGGDISYQRDQVVSCEEWMLLLETKE